MKQTTSLPSGLRLTVEVTDSSDDETALARASAAARRELEAFLGRVDAPPAPHPSIIGRSAPMLALFKMLERIQQSDATVLVLGENGTGKELVAKSIHRSSRRAGKAFVATNCSAFNDNLLESELFGHRRGAFTGAVADKPGLFEVADGGTFFMDEVGDMSPSLQVKLLRVIQEGTFMPVGGTETKRVDVRIVAATNRDLSAMMKQGSFREDLYYRLHVVVVRVPPLRERHDPDGSNDDIALLVEHFLDRLARRDRLPRGKVLTARALERLLAHTWPGNVRELENEMERLWVLSGEETLIDEELLSPSIGRRKAPAPSGSTQAPTLAAAASPRAPSTSAPEPKAAPTLPTDAIVFEPGVSMPDAVERLERRMIGDELRKTRGNKTKAADALGISRRNLIRKVQTYGLDDVGRGRGEN